MLEDTEDGKVGEWENGSAGKWVGELESGRVEVEEWENATVQISHSPTFPLSPPSIAFVESPPGGVI